MSSPSRSRDAMRMARVAAAGMLVLAAGCRGRSQPSGAPKAPSVVAGTSWIEITFPMVDLDSLGCPMPAGGTRRWYTWGVSQRFPDAAQSNHFVQSVIGFTLPADVPMTWPRLDSALARQEIVVQELSGQPISLVRRTSPSRSRATLENRQVRLRIEGDEALRALLGPGSDTMRVMVCRRDPHAPHADLPIVRR